MFTFTPLLGAQSTSRASQSILELDGGVKILVDIGWDEHFDTKLLADLEKHASTLSFILITHSTISHLGAYAHCCKHIPLFSQIPVYATSPVIAFGRTLLQDLYSSSPLAATFIPSTTSEDEILSNEKDKSNILRQPPTFDEINKYFSSITPLKYSQPYQPTASQFSSSLEGLTLTAYNSGHTLGGTIWHIQHGMESIVYAVDWNQARENVIAGAAWFGGVGGSEVIEQLRNPTALVCSSVGGDQVALSGSRKARDDALLGHIRSSLRKGGVVLIPTDSSARILELSWMLEKAWSEGGSDEVFKNAKIFMASKAANATLRHARSLLEWMDDSIVREFEADDDQGARSNITGSTQVNGNARSSRPFEFKHIKLVERRSRLEKILSSDGPKVILASDLSLDWGFSKQSFQNISQKTENLILLTERFSVVEGDQSLGHQLWQWYEERQDGVALESSLSGDQIEQVHCGGRQIYMRNVRTESLDAQEANRYQQYVAAQKQLLDSLTTDNERDVAGPDDQMDDSSSSSSDESDDEQQGRALNASTAFGHGSRNKVALTDEDLGVSILFRKKGVYDYDVRNKKGRNAIFPYTHSRKRGDDFGDVIKPEDFLRDEEKEDQDSGIDLKSEGILGQKRKWDELDTAKSQTGLKRKGGVGSLPNGTAANSEIGGGYDDSDDDEVDLAMEESQGPVKVIFSQDEITVNARLAFVDFSGIHDQRSLQMLIPLIGPKKLILTAGTSREIISLASDCKELLSVKHTEAGESTTEIFTPMEGQTIDASVDTNAWVVKLSRNLAKKLHWQTVKNIGIFTLQGELKGESAQALDIYDDPKTKKQKLDTEISLGTSPPPDTPIQPVLDTLPPALAASIRSVTQPIHVGDMRLADLRRMMTLQGHTAEFRGEGTLLVDGIVAVRKLTTGKLIIEGVPVSTVTSLTTKTTDNFTLVKQRIYEGLAVVAPG